jgi:uncharacterized phage protein (TIGR01671 family)
MSQIPEYRAWHKENKRMYDVCALYLGKFAQGISLIRDDSPFLTCPLGDVELMQHIGRKAKGNQGVFVGDILAYGNNRGLIKDMYTWVWLQVEDEEGGVSTDIFDREKHVSTMTGFEQAEVIGNVWENPELLEEKE